MVHIWKNVYFENGHIWKLVIFKKGSGFDKLFSFKNGPDLKNIPFRKRNKEEKIRTGKKQKRRKK